MERASKITPALTKQSYNLQSFSVRHRAPAAEPQEIMSGLCCTKLHAKLSSNYLAHVYTCVTCGLSQHPLHKSHAQTHGRILITFNYSYWHIESLFLDFGQLAFSAQQLSDETGLANHLVYSTFVHCDPFLYILAFTFYNLTVVVSGQTIQLLSCHCCGFTSTQLNRIQCR